MSSNPSILSSSRNACAILEMFDRYDIPVILGRTHPMQIPFDGEGGMNFHGHNGY